MLRDRGSPPFGLARANGQNQSFRLSTKLEAIQRCSRMLWHGDLSVMFPGCAGLAALWLAFAGTICLMKQALFI